MSRNEDWISEELTKEALNLFQKKKSPRPDEIKRVIFKHLPLNFIRHLVFIYRSVILLKNTSKLWKSTKVIFIPKPAKKNYNIPKAFRPISLSNYFLKTLERLVCWKLEDDLRSNPLHEAQHGFTKNKSTESAAASVVNYVEKHIYNKQHCIGVFLDISSAFNTIKPDLIKN